MRFEDVIGQKQVKAMLVKGVGDGRISHAQLFTGQSGYGTMPLAVAYAQYLNCTDKRDGDSCGVCPSCRKIVELVHPDLHFVFPMNAPKSGSGSQKPTCDIYMPQWRELFSSTGGYFDEQTWYRAINIENQQGIISRNDADEIIRKLSFKPFEAKYKVMIIWLPERMRIEAANTLLKILEEPWDRTIFLLVSEKPELLLPTIISRTQEITVPGIEAEEVEKHIVAKYKLPADKADRISRLSRGNILEAERLVASGDNNTATEYFNIFKALMRLSYNDRHMELLEWADNTASMGREEQKRFLQYSVGMLRENYMLNAGMDEVTYLWGEELEFSRNFSPFIGNHNIEKLVSEMELAIAQISQNGNPKIIFSHFALAVSKLITRL